MITPIRLNGVDHWNTLIKEMKLAPKEKYFISKPKSAKRTQRKILFPMFLKIIMNIWSGSYTIRSG